ncbi:MAG: hypothetical protein RLZZ238_1568 [Planctomycetota bacterium]
MNGAMRPSNHLTRLPHGGMGSEPLPARSRCLLAARPSHSVRSGFTLVEMLVVISIVALLTGLLMPSISRARQAADRLRCANHLRQVGAAIVGYLDDNSERLPALEAVETNNPRYSDGMILTSANGEEVDGLGRLMNSAPLGGYLPDTELLYCPCHKGEHPHSRYASQIGGYMLDTEPGTPAFCNYHYRSPIDPVDGKRLRNPMRPDLVLATDGMRTRSDFNHITGANRLFGDTHVDWRADVGREILDRIPLGVGFYEPPIVYRTLWELIDAKQDDR